MLAFLKAGLKQRMPLGDMNTLVFLRMTCKLVETFSLFFASLHNNIFAEDSVTAFCLHPADWEVRVPRACNVQDFSNILYESPEPCNWGPIWRFSECRAYMSWVSALKDAGEDSELGGGALFATM
jgi:hypothetical protein